ncbi:chemotaxis protein CheX [Anoxynatronum buryatiense]|uniref:Chemotaxis protein CheX n=1 Tax=Anoxynatronum buryatiense TaxID=489973 RepID=A0AA45WWS8_9CLOT|nr:chemotaxis protein CheX [Anoxynatronum buryatiense]SMP60598.1 chemotaxis protein CheX [Anoxynatronum buryatiense]
MDVKWINPFIEAFMHVMPQLGFQTIEKSAVTLGQGKIKSAGVIMNLGIVGELTGNVVYNIEMETAKGIASKMMMGMPVAELDEMAQSAISELSNMLTANASINFSKMDISTNISTPTLMYGTDFEVMVNMPKYVCVEMNADGLALQINVAVRSQ